MIEQLEDVGEFWLPGNPEKKWVVRGIHTITPIG